MPENSNPTTINDMSNSDAKDGLLKDVYTKRKPRRKAEPKSLRKTIFGPHTKT